MKSKGTFSSVEILNGIMVECSPIDLDNLLLLFLVKKGKDVLIRENRVRYVLPVFLINHGYSGEGIKPCFLLLHCRKHEIDNALRVLLRITADNGITVALGQPAPVVVALDDNLEVGVLYGKPKR